jgi:predicted DNA-binding transcriptional regulator AlpA
MSAVPCNRASFLTTSQVAAMAGIKDRTLHRYVYLQTLTDAARESAFYQRVPPGMPRPSKLPRRNAGLLWPEAETRRWIAQFLLDRKARADLAAQRTAERKAREEKRRRGAP